MKLYPYLAFLLIFVSAAHAERPDNGQLNSALLSTPQVNFTQGELSLSHGLTLAQASEKHNEPEITEVSYRYKLLIGDVTSLGLIIAAPFSDGITAPFGIATYFLASPLIHIFEPDNQEGGSKALWSLWYRLGIPTLGAGLGLASLYLMDTEGGSGLLFAYAFGLGSLVGGVYGLYKDYKSAVRQVKGSGTRTARYQDRASQEVLMWQALMAHSARSTRVDAH